MNRSGFSPAPVAFLAALIGVLSLPGQALGQGALANGASHSGTIAVSGQVDSWTFTATAGDAIVVSLGEVVNGSTLSPWVRVFNPSASLAGEKFDLQVSQVNVTASQSGTYTVLVGSRDFNGVTTGTGAYRLTLAQVPGAFTISGGDEGGAMTNGAQHTGTIPLGDLDMWSFTATAGDALALNVGEIVNGSTLSPWIRLFNPAGTQVGTKFDLQASQLSVTATQSGTYTVVVGTSDFNGFANGTGDYRLTIARVPAAFTVSGGDDGGAMANGAEHTGTIPMGDLDMWSFTATAGDAIALSVGEIVDGSTLSPWIRLFNPAGVQLGSKFDLQVSQINVSAAQTGTYTVVIGTSDFNGMINGVGDYRLTLAKVPGALTMSAGDQGGAIASAAPQAGTIVMGDLDLWTFTAHAGDAITVNLTETVNGATLSPWIRVFSPTGALVGQHFNLDTSQVNLSALATGTYTVIVGTTNFNGNVSGVGDYQLVVSGNLDDWIQNGDFDSGVANWLLFEVPDIVHNSAANGVFEYHRANPTTTSSKQAVIFQNTGRTVPAGTPLTALFDIGNSDGVRKRISVLIIDADFSDLSVCTFYLAPQAPLRTFAMKTHPTKSWANAAIYFYAASSGGGAGANYLLDNISLRPDPTGSPNRTDCIDPLAPSVPGGPSSPNLIVNGDFASGVLSPWGLFGDITSQISAGVFEFLRPGTPGQPAGVILQVTGATLTANEVLTASFDLGNTSAIRKRVTVLLHDLDFTDLTACTFWLEPGQALGTYSMRSFATKAWANATLSVYAATTGAQSWIRLDNVTLQRTPGITALGTECMEVGASNLSARVLTTDAPPFNAVGAPTPATPTRQAPAAPTRATVAPAPIALVVGPTASLVIELFFSGPDDVAEVQVSVDGATWERVALVRASDFALDERVRLRVDLTPYAGLGILVRVVGADYLGR